MKDAEGLKDEVGGKKKLEKKREQQRKGKSLKY